MNTLNQAGNNRFDPIISGGSEAFFEIDLPNNARTPN